MRGDSVRDPAPFGRFRQGEVAWSAASLLVGAKVAGRAVRRRAEASAAVLGELGAYKGFLKEPVLQDTVAEDSVCTTMAGLSSSAVKNLS